MWIWIFSTIAVLTQAQTPKVSLGTLDHYADFKTRNWIPGCTVDVWLPPGYSTEKRYDVLYMHDGQMLFDSSSTWNHQEWGVDETAGRMMARQQIRPCIVVGIWNTGAERHSDYFPQKIFDRLSFDEKRFLLSAGRMPGTSVFSSQPLRSDKYLRFIVKELKPFIDSVYATMPDREHTHIAGSSMGGLISLYAICEYPDVFGSAACISTHWPVIFSMDNNPVPAATIAWLKEALPKPGKNRIYFDCGTATLDEMYPPIQKEIDAVLKSKGYTSKDRKTILFKDADHSEKAWAFRLNFPLEFMLKK